GGAVGDTAVHAAARGAGAGDRRCDVRAVTVLVGEDLLAGHEARRVGGDVALHVGVRVVDARVEHRDRHALAGVALGPGFGSVDVGNARVEGRLDLAVEVDGLDAVGERGSAGEGADTAAGARERRPRLCRVVVTQRRGRAVDAGELRLHVEARNGC